MKRKFLLILLVCPFLATAQINFSNNFFNKSLRFDFLLGGNSETTTVFPVQLKEEPFWGGSLKNLVDTFNYGTYRFQIFDMVSDSLLFSKGFCPLFQEWQTIEEAEKKNKAFYQAAIFPFPKNSVRLKIDARQWDGKFRTIYVTEIDPANYFILKEKPSPLKSIVIEDNGDPGYKIDIVILAEGYKLEEMEKFEEDSRRVTNLLFEEEPFKSEREKFNIRAVFAPSVDSGTDIPGDSIYKNTFFNSSFYTFDMPRYLTTFDMKSVYDAAAVVPYDQIYLLVNSKGYGGGGFYNFLNVCTSDNSMTPQVFVHEFGHGFAGLGDEYYNSSVTFESYYNTNIEPWEPNLTTLVEFGKNGKVWWIKPHLFLLPEKYKTRM